MKNSAILVAAAATLIGVSFTTHMSQAQSPNTSGFRGPGGGGAAFRGPGGGGNFANAPRGGGFRGGPGRGGGGWHGGPGPRYYGGGGYYRGGPGPGFALGAAALGLFAGALLSAPPGPPVYADECMQQVWVRGAWRWYNACD